MSAKTPHELVLGLDLGTTALKAMAWDPLSGRVEHSVVVDYPSLVEGPAHEQDPAEWITALTHATRQLVNLVSPEAITAVGLSGHMHTLLLLDGRHRPVRPAITWADRRASRHTAVLAESDAFRHAARNDPVDAFTAPRLAWLAESEPYSLDTATVMLGSKDYLGLFLTGEMATDPTDALGTLLWNYETRQWDSELFALAGAHHTLGPPVLESVAPRGAITTDAAELTGLPPSIPVFCGAGDVSAVVLGSGVIDSSAICLNAGTAAQAMRLTTTKHFPNGFLFHSALGSDLVAMSASYAAGASGAWAQGVLTLSENLWDQPAGHTTSSLTPTYLPYMMGTAAPHKNDAVRGAFLGQSPSHTAADLAAAVVEGVAFSCADSVDQVAALGETPGEIIVVGGVSKSARWREALANTLDLTVRHFPDGGSVLGAVALAGIGSGMFDVDDLQRAVHNSAFTVEPSVTQSRDRASRDRFRHFSELVITSSPPPGDATTQPSPQRTTT